MAKKIFFIFIALFNLSVIFCIDAKDVPSKVNMAAAVASLEKAISLYASGDFRAAMFEAELGIGYAPNMADFPYLKALCADLLEEPSKYSLDYLSVVFNKDMMWHRYSKDDAILLASSLNLKLKNYNTTLKLIDDLPFETDNAQLIKAGALYGLSRRREAEELILSSLDRHSFDSRFPKLFMIQEKDMRKTDYSKKVADKILENLYVWKENEPCLLPLSVHFEKDDKINRRNLKIYREMHTHFLPSYTASELFLVGETILSNINYGVLSDEASIRELFSLKVELKDYKSGKKIIENAVYKPHVLRLSKIVGTPESRELIKGILSNYSGLVLEDENKDGILETILYYKSGRPDIALFDGEQCGYPEFVVECNFGIPKKVSIGETPHVLLYDEYPYVSSLQMEEDFFQMRPHTFKWQAFTLERLKLELFSDAEKHKSFFVLSLNTSIEEINETSLMHVAAYKERKNDDEVDRVFYDKGEIISKEKRIDGVLVSLANYRNGRPSVEKCDIDQDGYFERVQEYDRYGNLSKISLDFDKDGVFEYNEVYKANGEVRKEWIGEGQANGNVANKVVYTIYSSEDSLVEWVHPISGKLVRLHYIDGSPSSVDMNGISFPIIKDSEIKLYWFKSVPSASTSFVNIIKEKLKKEASPLFSLMVEVSGGTIFAVKSGGYIFAQYFGD